METTVEQINDLNDVPKEVLEMLSNNKGEEDDDEQLKTD